MYIRGILVLSYTQEKSFSDSNTFTWHYFVSGHPMIDIFHNYERIQFCAKRRVGSNTGKTEVIVDEALFLL